MRPTARCCQQIRDDIVNRRHRKALTAQADRRGRHVERGHYAAAASELLRIVANAAANVQARRSGHVWLPIQPLNQRRMRRLGYPRNRLQIGAGIAIDLVELGLARPRFVIAGHCSKP